MLAWVLKLAIVFAVGMIVADTLNAIWIAKLIGGSVVFTRPAARRFRSSSRRRRRFLVTGCPWQGCARLARSLGNVAPPLDRIAIVVLVTTGFFVAFGASRSAAIVTGVVAPGGRKTLQEEID